MEETVYKQLTHMMVTCKRVKETWENLFKLFEIRKMTTEFFRNMGSRGSNTKRFGWKMCFTCDCAVNRPTCVRILSRWQRSQHYHLLCIKQWVSLSHHVTTHIKIHINFTLPPLYTVCDPSSLGRLMPLTSPPDDSPVFREVVFADEPDKPLDACFLVLVLNDQYFNNQYGKCIHLAVN